MQDIKAIREHPDVFVKAMDKRGLKFPIKDFLAQDTDHRDKLTQLQLLQSQRNSLSQDFGKLKREGKDTSSLEKVIQEIKDQMTSLEESVRQQGDIISQQLLELPNSAASDVPIGKDENDNQVVSSWGEPNKFSFSPKHHYELGENLGLMDFTTAVKISGSRFVLLKGALAKLERCLARYMLDLHTKAHGYTEVSPPLLVTEKSMTGVGQLPKFKDEQFQTTQGHWLISTAETPLANMVADSVLQEAELTKRYTAFTPCFRAEAGAAGKDTRGMIRNHQFSKVELVAITTPEQSAAEHERLTQAAEAILQGLELPYQKMLLCSGDMGFAAQKTYDLNVWLPAQNCYREISSCSNCGDFQARRMNAKYKPADGGKPKFVHTLNGSGLAVGRTLVAVIENYQNADGSVTIPEPLRDMMQMDKISG